MSTEIIEAMTALANEKGISPDRLISALEDALLSAYMKQPDAVKYARVQLDPQTGDYRVIAMADVLKSRGANDIYAAVTQMYPDQYKHMVGHLGEQGAEWRLRNERP